MTAESSTGRRRVALLINPAAGRHDPAMLDRLAERLTRRGLEPEILVSRSPGDLAGRIDEVSAEVVAVSGGDGTINEVVGALAAKTGRLPRLAVIPNGTANVLAHEYGLPRHPEAIVAAIEAGRTRPLHLGRVHVEGEPERPFFLMTSVGFDAEVVHAVEARTKRRFKKLAFLITALRRGFGRRARLAVEVETTAGERCTLDCAMVVVAKAQHYGGPFVLTRATAMDRPGLRLVALADDRPRALLDAAWRIGLGRLEGSPNVTALDVMRVRIDTAGAASVHVQIDGEPCGHTPVEVAASDRVLELIVPEA